MIHFVPINIIAELHTFLLEPIDSYTHENENEKHETTESVLYGSVAWFHHLLINRLNISHSHIKLYPKSTSDQIHSSYKTAITFDVGLNQYNQPKTYTFT